LCSWYILSETIEGGREREKGKEEGGGREERGAENLCDLRNCT